MMKDLHVQYGALEFPQQDVLVSPHYRPELVAQVQMPPYITTSMEFHYGQSEEAQPGGKLSQLEAGMQTLGKEHPDTLDAMVNLASTYWKQRRWKEAEELEVPVFDIRKRTLRKEHPSTLDVMANLASTYWKQRRWKDAKELQAVC